MIRCSNRSTIISTNFLSILSLFDHQIEFSVVHVALRLSDASASVSERLHRASGGGTASSAGPPPTRVVGRPHTFVIRHRGDARSPTPGQPPGPTPGSLRRLVDCDDDPGQRHERGDKSVVSSVIIVSASRRGACCSVRSSQSPLRCGGSAATRASREGGGCRTRTGERHVTSQERDTVRHMTAVGQESRSRRPHSARTSAAVQRRTPPHHRTAATQTTTDAHEWRHEL